jgi:Type VI secretion system/phage-baseplate injector OB domain
MSISNLMEGVIVDTNDPQQMGRVKIWVPAIDGDLYNIIDLPWATYVSPLAGQTRDYPAGPESNKTSGLMSYGWFAVPKTGALAIVGFLYGDSNRRIYLGSYFRDHGNRSLPAGRNRSDLGTSPLSDTFEPVQPQSNNLTAQFSGQLTASEAKTRGVYERAVAQDKTQKDGTEGYQTDLVDAKDSKTGKAQYDPQTYSLSTPGRNALIFQDNPSNGRIRLKTAAGHQIILDDANERIYVSTARGNSWFEMDQDGRIHVYAADSISISSGADFNFTGGGNFNIGVSGNINIQAGAQLKMAACAGINISGNSVNMESSTKFDILAVANLQVTAKNIHFNGPAASSALCPDKPSIVPKHEPWVRSASKKPRNKNWKP